MSKINDAYINALLADATYGLKENKPNGYTHDELNALQKLKTRMTPTLASYISDNFTVVTHKETSDATGSGFDATVWKDAGGKTYVSMTGSQPAGLLADFVADFDLSGTPA